MLFVTKHTLEYRRDIILENPVFFLVLVRNTTWRSKQDFETNRKF